MAYLSVKHLPEIAAMLFSALSKTIYNQYTESEDKTNYENFFPTKVSCFSVDLPFVSPKKY